MKRLITALTVFTLLTSPITKAEDKTTSYISDNLYIYMHTGPGTEYRILGSISAGSEVTIVNKDSSSKYTQLIDSKGRKGWVETKFVSHKPSLKNIVPALEAELAQVKSALSSATTDTQAKTQTLIESLDLRNTQLKELEEHSNDLNQKLIDAQSEIRELRASLDTQKDDLLMRYFTYGGMVAGGGLMLGLVLPHILPRRKKRSGGWE